jgi:hypothetical protein
MNHLALQQQLTGKFDKSAAYSSYAFGDPSTPLARSYLGDRVKQRVVHGGSEVFHIEDECGSGGCQQSAGDVQGNQLMLASSLRFDHTEEETVSTEFVRYRWYLDAQFGTAYFHDHVDALHAWRHGLFGALIAEPPHATYHDPHSGALVRSGAIADVHTDSPVSADIPGSFREVATEPLWLARCRLAHWTP